MDAKSLGIGLFLIMLVFLAGCENGLTGNLVAIPDVKAKLDANPGSKFVVTPYNEQMVSANLATFGEYCGPGIEVKQYYMVELKDENNAVKSAMIVDKENKKVICTVDTNIKEFKDTLLANLKNNQITGNSIVTGPKYTGKTVKMEFYVMSQCPYGTQVMDGIAPVKKKLGDALDLSINYILYPKSQYAGKEAQYCIGDLCSMHGTQEAQGDIAELCAAKYEPNKYLDMIVCMDKNAGSIPGNWESCAKSSGLNVDKIKTCYNGDEGKQLLIKSAGNSQARGASGSPTMYLNGQPYSGGRDSISFQRAVCSAISSEHPECKNIPVCAANTDCPGQEGKIATCENPGAAAAKCTYKDDAKVQNIVLNDKKCTTCDTSQIIATTKSLFPGATVKYLDVNDEEGKKLVSDLKLIKAPVYLFDKNIVETNTWKTNTRIQGSFEQRGDYYKIRDEAVGATHFIDEKAREEYLKTIGVVAGDNKPQIDFFVMSYCPYGNLAEEGIEPVYQLLKGKADFVPHYVIYSDYSSGYPSFCIDQENKYCSMHGIQELNQDVRELCVQEKMGIDSTFKFMLAMNKECTAQNADTCWENVAKGLGLDTEKIKTCQKDEALTLLEKEKKLNDLLGVSGSPTIFIDGQEFQGGRDPESYKTGLCAAFDNAPAECTQTLAGGSQTAAPAGGCGA